MTTEDLLARAYAFLDRGDMHGNRRAPSSVGTAVYLDELPKTSVGKFDKKAMRAQYTLAVTA